MNADANTRAQLIKPDRARLLPVAALLEAALATIEAGVHHGEMHDVIHNAGLIVRQIACEGIAAPGDPAEAEALRVFDLTDDVDKAVAAAIAEGGDIRPLRAAARALLDYLGIGQTDAAA